jgi:hypothetical protein
MVKGALSWGNINPARGNSFDVILVSTHCCAVARERLARLKKQRNCRRFPAKFDEMFRRNRREYAERFLIPIDEISLIRVNKFLQSSDVVKRRAF